jgi:hypothetical protein
MDQNTQKIEDILDKLEITEEQKEEIKNQKSQSDTGDAVNADTVSEAPSEGDIEYVDDDMIDEMDESDEDDDFKTMKESDIGTSQGNLEDGDIISEPFDIENDAVCSLSLVHQDHVYCVAALPQKPFGRSDQKYLRVALSNMNAFKPENSRGIQKLLNSSSLTLTENYVLLEV